MTTQADHDKRCPAAWDTSVKCNCGAQAADEIALIEKTLESVGITSLLNHGAASCVFTEGCCGVSQEHILAYTRKIALHCAVALAAPPTAQAEGWRLIETAPEGQMVVVGWLDKEDADNPERHDFDLLEDGCWRNWHDHAEHVHVIGGHGVSYTAPYTVWMPVGTIPPTSAEGVASLLPR